MKLDNIFLFSKDFEAENVCSDMADKITTPVTVQTNSQTASAAQTNRPNVLIAIPTFRRSERLKKLLSHVEETLSSIYHVEILVVDNNSLPVEQKFVQKFSNTSIYPVHYIHEPKAGVSNARNAALQFATSRFVAFLDDDMEVTSGWIDSLVKVSIVNGTLGI